RRSSPACGATTTTAARAPSTSTSAACAPSSDNRMRGAFRPCAASAICSTRRRGGLRLARGSRNEGGLVEDAGVDRLERALERRLREVTGAAPVTERELRALAEKGEAWARTLGGLVAASERRLL